MESDHDPEREAALEKAREGLRAAAREYLSSRLESINTNLRLNRAIAGLKRAWGDTEGFEDEIPGPPWAIDGETIDVDTDDGGFKIKVFRVASL
jgi:hypothetical protein